MSDDHIGVKVNGVLYVKLEDARKLREGWDKADERIAELEAALEKQEAITKDDAKWMMAYHQWCVMNGCPPSSSNLIAAIDALIDTRHMGEKTYWYLKPDGPEAADRIAKLETHLEERKMSSGLVLCICSEADDRIKELKARIAEMATALQAIANICLVTCLRPGIEAQKMQAIAFCTLLKCNCGGECNQYGLCKSKAIAALGEKE